MATWPIADSVRIIWNMDSTNTPETVSYGATTYSDPAGEAEVSTIARTWWQNTLTGVAKARVELSAIVLQRWNGLQWITSSQEIFIPPVDGTGTDALPFQCAAVLSWETVEIGSSLGDKSRFNRMYLGHLTGGVQGPEGRMPIATQTALLASLTGLDDALKARVGAIGPSAGGLAVTSPQEGLSADVGLMRVGDVVDTQRRRRRQLQENYLLAVPT